MAKKVVAGLVIVIAAVIVVSFFQPWAKIDVSVTKVSRNLVDSASGPLKDSPFAAKFISKFNQATKAIDSLGGINVKAVVTGYDIPTVANREDSKTALSLLEIFFPDTKDLDKKATLVFLLPVCAIICALLAAAGTRNRIATLAMVAISGVIGTFGLFKLMTADLSNLMAKIVIGNGLRQTMYGFLAIFVMGIIALAADRKG